MANLKLETIADPAWSLVYQRGSTISNDIKTNVEVYSDGPDLFALVEKVKGKCPINLELLNLGKVRDWYLLISQDEEWFHKDTFELSITDKECIAFVNLDYIFDNYEIDYEELLSGLSKKVKELKTKTRIQIAGELVVYFESSDLNSVLDSINIIIAAYPPKKYALPLDRNWTLFNERLHKVLSSLSLSMPSIENTYSFNKLAFMSLLNQAIGMLQKKVGKEPILIQLSAMLTFLQSNPSVGDDLNFQLANLNRFLNSELTDWSKFSS